MKTPSKVQVSRTLCKSIAEFGVPIMAYQRNPSFVSDNGADPMILSISDNKTVRLWAGSTKPDDGFEVIDGDAKGKHVLVRVTEDSREFTKPVRIDLHESVVNKIDGFDFDMVRRFIETTAAVDTLEKKIFKSKKRFEFIKKRLFKRSDLSIPKSRRSLSNFVFEYNDAGGYSNQPVIVIRADVRYKVGRSVNTFIIGVDETAPFVCMLPNNNATSLTEAFESLRPKNVSDDAVRQGEWFFDPVNEDVAASLDRAYEEQLKRGRWIEETLERGSSHCCKTKVTLNRVLYVRGYVYDNRPNRHAPIHLDGWHRVNRNLEKVDRNNVNATSWD